MQKISERPEPKLDQVRDEGLRLRSWDGARAFLEVVRCGSFRAASQALRTSANSLRREIDEFEHDVGFIVFTRHVDGVRLTAEGELLVETVRRMEAASLDIARVRHLGISMDGEVRLSITEGLGTFWIAPRLVEFQSAYPGLLVDMRCAMHPADVLRLETDVAIQISEPKVKDLKVVKIGRLHAMLFAAPIYLERYGMPTALSDIRKHRIVLQVSDQVTSAEQFRMLFPGIPQVGTVAFRTNVSSTHYWVIARGAGIGALPSYAPLLGGKVVPVDVGNLRFSSDIWLTYHSDAARIPRIRRLIDWVIDAFSPKRYPWFADEFIHPRDLPDVIDGTPPPNLFGGFDGVRPPH